MKKKTSKTGDEPCQYFEFLLRLPQGTERIDYTLPQPDADSLVNWLTRPHPDPGAAAFVDFPCVNGRYVHLNLDYLVGLSRLNLVGRASANRGPRPRDPDDTDLEIHDWPSLNASHHRPGLALFIDGLPEPLLCQELDRQDLEEVAFAVQAGPHENVSYLDPEELRTRLIPVRNIILMESIDYR